MLQPQGSKKRCYRKWFPYFCEEYGNPSSMYSVGREAKRALEKQE